MKNYLIFLTTLFFPGMHSKNEYEKNYNWIGAQIGYKLDSSISEVNYRVYAYTTNKKFENRDADTYKALKGVGVSFDYELIKETLGGFFSAEWQDDRARIDYNRMVSLTQAFESYVKFKLLSYKAVSSDVTLDYQYIQDKERENSTKAGHIYGFRFNVNF